MSNSDTFYSLLKSVTPGGSQTLSKMPCRFPEIYPKVLDHGEGGHVWDVDGREYIDLIAGLGAVSVGYANAEVNKAIFEQLTLGASFSLPNMMEYHMAKKLIELVPWTEMWKFGKNGTDGTVMAVRAARAYTGREKIMTVGYNGCQEMFECRGVRNAGIPKVLAEHNTRATYNDPESFADLLKGEYACLLLEPMVYDDPKSDFLQLLGRLCSATNTLLIFDEVVDGGRFKGFTAHAKFNVQPDLVVLGKAIANGLPLCAVGGKREVMQTFERDDFFASGTFGGEAVSLAAGLKTVEILAAKIPEMVVRGQHIQNTFNALPWGAICTGYPTRLTFHFPSGAHEAVFKQEMCRNGVLVGSANFIMADHTADDVYKITQAIYSAYHVLKDCWSNPLLKLEGSLPTEVMLRKP